MRPYYTDDLVTLYHGDCLSFLPHVGPADAVLTDPPYNVGFGYDEHDDRMDEVAYLDWLSLRFALCASNAARHRPIVWTWPGSRLANGNVREVLPTGYVVHHVGSWFKREFAGDMWKGGHPAYSWEPIVWARHEDEPAVYHGRKGGHEGRDGLIANSPRHDGAGWHPCPKPLSVMATVLSWIVGPGETVLDPFAGSGTVLLAAKRAGVKAIGIELSEAYCEGIAERLAQQTLGLSA